MNLVEKFVPNIIAKIIIIFKFTVVDERNRRSKGNKSGCTTPNTYGHDVFNSLASDWR
jgi:hypothetical protein